MTGLIVVVLLIVASYGIYHFLSRERSAPKHSIRRHEKTMTHLRKAAGHRPQITETDSLWDKKFLGLPPLSVVAAAISLTVVVIAVIAGIVLLINDLSSSGSSVVKGASTTKAPKITNSSQTSSTVLNSISPVSTSSSTDYYQAPSGTYQISVSVSQPTWVEITVNFDGSNPSNVVAEVLSPDQSASAQVSGHVKITLGKPDASVEVNGISINIPNQNSVTAIEFT
jgi:hypothetical protein